MNYDVLDARDLGGDTVWPRFRDGTMGETRLLPALRGPVFEALHPVAEIREQGQRSMTAELALARRLRPLSAMRA